MRGTFQAASAYSSTGVLHIVLCPLPPAAPGSQKRSINMYEQMNFSSGKQMCISPEVFFLHISVLPRATGKLDLETNCLGECLNSNPDLTKRKVKCVKGTICQRIRGVSSQWVYSLSLSLVPEKQFMEFQWQESILFIFRMGCGPSEVQNPCGACGLLH